jgi:putative endonuclease
MYWVYVLRCCDRSLYIGHTEGLEQRLKAHNDGRGAAFTAARRPVRIVYAEEHASVLTAIQRERQIKRWNRVKKEALVAGDVGTLRHWSCRSRAKR